MFLLISVFLFVDCLLEAGSQSVTKNSKILHESLPLPHNYISATLTPQYKIPIFLEKSEIGKSKTAVANFNDKDSKRQPKFLEKLALLAGLNVLATAPSANINTFTKIPRGQFFLNFGHSGWTPYFSAYYEPYSFIPYSYPSAYPSFPWHPFLEPSKVQSIAQLPLQNPITPPNYNLLPDKKPTDQETSEETYIAENKMLNKKKMENQERVEGMEAELRMKSATSEEMNIKKEETEDVILKTEATVVNEEARAGNIINTTTQKPVTIGLSTTTQMVQNNPGMNVPQVNTNQTNTNSTTMTNTTDMQNKTEDSGFPGYYGGTPQEIGNIGLTTDTSLPGYHGYSGINYNLPFDRPANFNPYDRYEIYSNPPSNTFSPGEQAPEYLNAIDFNRYTYAPDNPSVFNGFRPII
ncbi:uncharacterized protein LOC107274504 [Cephus cinctus]|uniref:Uncharacterized protein LOC107274504 n=1 Tax=Cephus cinctus TaxID=211228 RepID=A0AAJ7FUR2_CEPCN|nr:uncharacterized protein LOC107274504 [Cephus cinctus]